VLDDDSDVDATDLDISGSVMGVVAYAADSDVSLAGTIESNGSGVWASGPIAISACTISDNTTNGVYFYSGSSASVAGCTLEDNTVGVYTDNSGTTIAIAGNTFTGNTAAIKADSYSAPVVRSNKIHGNTNGVAVQNSANPDVGRDSGSNGNNSFKNSSGYHISNLNASGTIEANYNYFAKPGPVAGSFYGSVDYTPYLGSDPLPSAPVEPETPRQNPKLPTAFGLTGAHPNPFNPSITIAYDVPAAGGIVDIAVYNVAGQRMATLVNQPHASGSYEVQWSGRFDNGRSAASGVYFVRLVAGSFEQTRKITLVK